MAQLAPSILSCDFSRLRDQLYAAERGGAHIIHIDVMDGHFVPNLTFGPLMVQTVREILPKALLDVHLMMDNPFSLIEHFSEAGADWITFHQEAVADFDLVVNTIRRSGSSPGIALCPGTPVHVLDGMLEKLDMVLLLTVNPGFGGQKFIHGMEKKIENLRDLIRCRGLSTLVEIDGGVNRHNIEYLASRGASVIVAGSFVFSDHERIEKTVRELTHLIDAY